MVNAIRGICIIASILIFAAGFGPIGWIIGILVIVYLLAEAAGK